MDVPKLLKILVEWSVKNEEYYMTYVLFTEFKTALPVKLLYELKTRKVVTLDSIHDDSKVITDKHLLLLTECLKRSKYGNLVGGGFGYTVI